MPCNTTPVLTHIGGPTLLIEIGNVRFLTDPTFDPAREYPLETVPYSKTLGPAIDQADLPPIDAVLLTHDQHTDNLDETGRAFLPRARTILTTVSGAGRLQGGSVGLSPWNRRIVRSADGWERVAVTATPARHGPPGSEGMTGEVIGFCLEWEAAEGAIYLSGDTVWYEGVAEVGQRFKVETAVLFFGAAVVPALGTDHYTLTAEEGVSAAQALDPRYVVPVHYDGWKHFSEGRAEVTRAFETAGIESKLRWLLPGRRTPQSELAM